MKKFFCFSSLLITVIGLNIDAGNQASFDLYKDGQLIRHCLLNQKSDNQSLDDLCAAYNGIASTTMKNFKDLFGVEQDSVDIAVVPRKSEYVYMCLQEGTDGLPSLHAVLIALGKNNRYEKRFDVFQGCSGEENGYEATRYSERGNRKSSTFGPSVDAEFADLHCEWALLKEQFAGLIKASGSQKLRFDVRANKGQQISVEVGGKKFLFEPGTSAEEIVRCIGL